MNLPIHLWIALATLVVLLLFDCRVFYRNAVQGDAAAGWLEVDR